VRRVGALLAKVWHALKDLPARLLGWLTELGARLRFNRARILWYAPFFIGAAGQVYNAWAQLYGTYGPPDIGHALTATILAVLLALWPISRRHDYRQAWRTGFLEGIHVPAEVYHGRVPDIVTRQSVTGSAAPEPWERSTSWDLTTTVERKGDPQP